MPAAFLAAGLVSGCAGVQAGGVPVPLLDRVDPSCRVESRLLPSRIRVIVDDSGPYASPFSAPATLTRLVQRQASATLVFTDCTGAVLPGLAERWRPEPGGSTWTFTLRQGIRKPDGSALDAAVFRDAWLTLGDPAARQIGVRNLTVASPREIRVEFSSPHLDARAFDDPGLAPLARTVGGGVTLEIEEPSSRDARDVLDNPDSTDATTGTMVLTRSPTAIAYARQLPDWQVVPLAWDAVHLLMVAGGGTPVVPDSGARAALAQDAVPGEARAAGERGWWDASPACQEPPALMRPVGRRLAYLEGDPVGRGLAERIVALAESGRPPDWIPAPLRRAPGGATPLIAVGMAPAALRAALAAGTLTGAVVMLPMTRPLSCTAMLVRVTGMSEIPLVQTRGYLLTRGPMAPFVIDGRGGVLFGVRR